MTESLSADKAVSKGFKVAITGKGGVGKTTLASLLCHLYKDAGRRVIAVDADPDANLGSALGFPASELATLKPLAEMADLIEERTGARPGKQGGMFRLNPKVDDVPDSVGLIHDGINLLIMGRSKEAASGCYCPESVFLRRLLRHLIVERDEVVIVDMEAGIEHLTRGTADSVDAFIVVVEPGKRSLQTAQTVRDLAAGLGVKQVFVVANKVRGQTDLDFLKDSIQGMEFLGSMGFDTTIMEADIQGVPPHLLSAQAKESATNIRKRLEDRMSQRA